MCLTENYSKSNFCNVLCKNIYFIFYFTEVVVSEKVPVVVAGSGDVGSVVDVAELEPCDVVAAVAASVKSKVI